MEISDELYEEVDRSAYNREDKVPLLKKYNKEHGTNFKYSAELIHKLTEEDKTSEEIGKILKLSKTCIRDNIIKLGITPRPKGGRRNPKMVTFEEVTKPISEWAKEYEISPELLRARLKKFSVEESLTRPIKVYHHRRSVSYKRNLKELDSSAETVPYYPEIDRIK